MTDRLDRGVELLDGPLEDQAELAGNLVDLGRVNRWLGGVALSAAALDVIAPGAMELTLLDVGTGGADIPMALLRRAGRCGQHLTVTGLDSRPEVLAAARLAHPALDGMAGLTLELGDGRSLPYADGAFDVAHCSLLLHHLAPAAATDLVGEMARVARRGVIVNDLDRGWLYWLGAWLLGHTLTGNRYTRHDAPLSVRRAYHPAEAFGFVWAAGLTPLRTWRGFLGHRYAIAAMTGPVPLPGRRRP